VVRRLWTIIGVRNVAHSFRWHQSLLGLPPAAPEHEDFEQVLDSDGTVVLCLHEWGAHDHPTLRSPRDPDGYYVMVSALTESP
jgi:hypothetical protein